jgi:serine/threonine protein kinase
VLLKCRDHYMSLAMATRLGPYEIVAPIGVGGMGEVYRARDTRLNRDVAVNVTLRGRERVLLSSPANLARYLERWARPGHQCGIAHEVTLPRTG